MDWIHRNLDRIKQLLTKLAKIELSLRRAQSGKPGFPMSIIELAVWQLEQIDKEQEALR